jgi:hypothetical protein
MVAINMVRTYRHQKEGSELSNRWQPRGYRKSLRMPVHFRQGGRSHGLQLQSHLSPHRLAAQLDLARYIRKTGRLLPRLGAMGELTCITA